MKPVIVTHYWADLAYQQKNITLEQLHLLRKGETIEIKFDDGAYNCQIDYISPLDRLNIEREELKPPQ